MLAHARTCPGETGAHSRITSIPAEYGNLQCPRAVIPNGHVHHGDRDARAPHFIRIDDIAHDNLDDHDYLCRTLPGYNSYNEV
jgi:hypothetical protein